MPSGIPSAVQQQADEAKRKAETAGESPEPESPEEPAPDNEPASPEAKEGPQEPAAKTPEQMSRDELQSELDKPLPPSATEGTQEAYWEHRFKVVKGLLDKEKAQFNREREQLNSRIRELEEQANRQPQQPAQPQADADLTQLREEYGPDDPMVKALEAERERNRRLEQQMQSLQGSQQEAGEERFWTDLNAEVPDWETINGREDFLTWLNLPDPVSGEIRDHLLQRHQQKGDGKRAAAIFKAFLSENPQVQQELRGKPESQQPNPEVQQQVEPTRTKTDAEPEQPPVYAMSDYKQFMTDVTKGKYTPEQAQYWREEYSKAIAEGRIDHSR